MVQIALPEQTVEKLNRSAVKRGLDPNQLLIQLVEEFLANEPAFVEDVPAGRAAEYEKIAQEQRHYEAQHAAILSQYRGHYIAMHEGKLVDHDLDRVAVSRRIRQKYGHTAILITQVREEPKLTITVRSPRLVRLD